MVLRSLLESTKYAGVRVSVVTKNESCNESRLIFFQRPYWMWQLQCPLCEKIHSGNYRAHKQAHQIMRDLLPTQFKNVTMGEIL